MYDDGKKKMLCHHIVHRIIKSMIEQGTGKIDIKDMAALF